MIVARVRLTTSALQDLNEIAAYLQQQAGALVADGYDGLFLDLFDTLRQTPGTGAPRKDYGRQARLCVIDPYNVYYDWRRRENLVVVVRVIHGSRKITAAEIRSGRRS